MTLPGIGQVTLPAAEQLAFLGGLGALAVIGIVEWPVAVAVGIGHALVQNRQSKTCRTSARRSKRRDTRAYPAGPEDAHHALFFGVASR